MLSCQIENNKSIPEALHLGAIVGAGSVAHLGDYAGYPTMTV